MVGMVMMVMSGFVKVNAGRTVAVVLAVDHLEVIVGDANLIQ
jgi:hypothetical protein